MDRHMEVVTNRYLTVGKIKMDYRANDIKEHWYLHSHMGYEIFYFQEGNANYIISDKVYQIKPGDMLIFNGEVHHRPNPDNGVYVRSYINFLPDFLKNIVEVGFYEEMKALFNTEHGILIRWSQEEQQEIDDIISKISEEFKQEKIRYHTMMISYLSNLLIKIYRKSDEINLESLENTTGQKYKHVRRILKFVNQNYMNNLTLDVIADSIYLNKYYMCHCFKEVTGCTVTEHLTNRRIEEGKKLLMTTEKTVGAISVQIGFNSAVQFSRLFKQHEHVPPQVYRKRQINIV